MTAKTITLQGVDAVDYLRGPNSPRDGSLVSMSIEQPSTAPTIKLTFQIPRCEGGFRSVEVTLTEVEEYEYSFSNSDPHTYLEEFKCLMTETGDFYISLDPYDEREAFISDKDNHYFRSRAVKLTASEAF